MLYNHMPCSSYWCKKCEEDCSSFSSLQAKGKTRPESCTRHRPPHALPSSTSPSFQARRKEEAMTVFAVWIINKAGGLVYNRTFARPSSALL